MKRYTGRQVRVSTYGHVKIIGRVRAVFTDCIRLVDALVLGELDDQGWFSQMQYADPESNHGPRDSEAVIPFHTILSVACLDDAPLDAADPAAGVDATPQEPDDDPKQHARDALSEALRSSPIELQIGVSLIRLADPQRGGDLLDRIGAQRIAIAAQLGIIVPRVQVRDSVSMDPDCYEIYIHGGKVGGARLLAGRLLAIDSGQTGALLEGVETVEPAFGRPAVWIHPESRKRAEACGWHVAEPVAVVMTHLVQSIKRHAWELLSYDHVAELLEQLQQRHPTTVKEVAPECISIPHLHHLLCCLLQESVSLKPLGRILECLGSPGVMSGDAESRLAKVRQTIGRTICERLRDESGALRACALDESLAVHLTQFTDAGDNPKRSAVVKSLAAAICLRWEETGNADRPLIIVVPATIRRRIRQVLCGELPSAAFLAYSEIPREIPLEIPVTIDSLDAADQTTEHSELRRTPK
ncbi:MAG: FHIPEP family type III secretion protein [Pirellulaceae bacterium]